MLIAIDYDNTYTAARQMFARFMGLCDSFGHQVICVTGRSPDHPIDDMTHPCPVIYADGKLKREAAEAAGYQVDIWIDDEPGTIERCLILDWGSDPIEPEVSPCPVCKSANVYTTELSADYGENGYYEGTAAECGDCHCQAPIDAWQKAER